MNTICYVCGFDMATDMIPNEHFVTNQIIPFYQCTCCCFHYLIDDNGEKNAYVNYRNEWIEKGLLFCSNPHPLNETWSLEVAKTQLENLKRIKLNDIKAIENEYFGYVESILKYNKNWTSEIDMNQVEFYWKKARKQ